MSKNIYTEFVELQKKLIDSFEKKYPSIHNNKWLVGIDSNSLISVNKQCWQAIKHGAGIRFTRKIVQPHLVIDVHNHLDQVERIDALRWQEYTESRGIQISFESAASELAAAKDEGVLVSLDDFGYQVLKT
jgi:hypothetical protein